MAWPQTTFSISIIVTILDSKNYTISTIYTSWRKSSTTFMSVIVTCTKVVVFLFIFNLFPSPMITLLCDFVSLIHAHVWNYWKRMTWLNVNGHYSLNGNGCNLWMVCNDQLQKFINNSYYFKIIYFLQVALLHLKFCKPIFFWILNLFQTILKCLKLTGIATTTLYK